jgi:hypothetical protein
MRFARGDMRDHTVSHRIDHGASYRQYGVLPRRSRLKIKLLRDFRRRSIFDFCNAIESGADLAQTFAEIHDLLHAAASTNRARLPSPPGAVLRVALCASPRRLD